ncbi:hypothetical protein BT93_C1721 [Corymbia citriodora subsp. variegata]|nr:hypothetical protein BT93_C1721 [Corymbia citriodora subsp. variegata]KAF8035781.1 hypothetical protein BT93_C1721 [Corymbia citriodora subsp. variegata]
MLLEVSSQESGCLTRPEDSLTRACLVLLKNLSISTDARASICATKLDLTSIAKPPINSPWQFRSTQPMAPVVDSSTKEASTLNLRVPLLGLFPDLRTNKPLWIGSFVAENEATLFFPYTPENSGDEVEAQ